MTVADSVYRIDAARHFYAEELRFVAHVAGEAVIRAFASVPRERFLGPGPWQVLGEDRNYWPTPDADPSHVYHNVLIAIDVARGLNNGHPQFWAHQLDRLDLHPGDAVCHVGAGTGYYTAIQAEIVGPDGRVIGIEVDPELATRARNNLADRTNVEVRTGDGSLADPGPVDAVIVNAGATHPMPGWLSALKPGGRMLLPLTTERDNGIVLRIERLGEDAYYAASVVSRVTIYPCAGARERREEQVLIEALAGGGQHFVRSLRLDRHTPDDTCWLHGRRFCLSIKPPIAVNHAYVAAAISPGPAIPIISLPQASVQPGRRLRRSPGISELELVDDAETVCARFARGALSPSGANRRGSRTVP
jgi:protein-L-isoaspartate(D-aspartate) O-methyltransferase